MAVVQKSGGFFFVDYASGSDSVCDSVFEDDRGDDVDDDDEEEGERCIKVSYYVIWLNSFILSA